MEVNHRLPIFLQSAIQTCLTPDLHTTSVKTQVCSVTRVAERTLRQIHSIFYNDEASGGELKFWLSLKITSFSVNTLPIWQIILIVELFNMKYLCWKTIWRMTFVIGFFFFVFFFVFLLLLLLVAFTFGTLLGFVV